MYLTELLAASCARVRLPLSALFRGHCALCSGSYNITSHVLGRRSQAVDPTRRRAEFNRTGPGAAPSDNNIILAGGWIVADSANIKGSESRERVLGCDGRHLDQLVVCCPERTARSWHPCDDWWRLINLPR